MSYQTTKDERGPRIGALVHDADRATVQALLEIAVDAIAEMPTRDAAVQLPSGALSLVAQIAATRTPSSEPAFAIGTPVRHAEGDKGSPNLGRVTERYLNEHGDWEYQIRGEFGTAPYREGELAEGRLG